MASQILLTIERLTNQATELGTQLQTIEDLMCEIDDLRLPPPQSHALQDLIHEIGGWLDEPQNALPRHHRGIPGLGVNTLRELFRMSEAIEDVAVPPWDALRKTAAIKQEIRRIPGFCITGGFRGEPGEVAAIARLHGKLSDLDRQYDLLKDWFYPPSWLVQILLDRAEEIEQAKREKEESDEE